MSDRIARLDVDALTVLLVYAEAVISTHGLVDGGRPRNADDGGGAGLEGGAGGGGGALSWEFWGVLAVGLLGFARWAYVELIHDGTKRNLGDNIGAYFMLRHDVGEIIRSVEPDWLPRGYSDSDIRNKLREWAADKNAPNLT